MHIDVVPNRNSRPAYLLRESYRDGKTVKKRTIANLSSLSEEQIAAFRVILSGQKLAPVNALFEIESSYAHGHVNAVSVAMSRLKVPALLSTRPSRERDLVCAMIVAPPLGAVIHDSVFERVRHDSLDYAPEGLFSYNQVIDELRQKLNAEAESLRRTHALNDQESEEVKAWVDQRLTIRKWSRWLEELPPEARIEPRVDLANEPPVAA